MKKIILYALLCILLNASMVFATPNWIQIDNKLYIDTNSLRKENYLGSNYGNYYSAWIKKLNDGSEVFTDFEIRTKTKIWYSVSLVYFDCNNKSEGFKSTTIYDLKNYPIGTYTLNDLQLSFHPIIPGTNGETMYNYACQYSKGGY